MEKKIFLENEKEQKSKEKEKIIEELKNIQYEIAFIIVKLQSTSQKPELISMNKNHIKNEDEYIDNLKKQMKDTGLKEEKQKEKLNEIKKQNKKIKEALKLNNETISILNEKWLTVKLKKLLLDREQESQKSVVNIKKIIFKVIKIINQIFSGENLWRIR